MKIIGQEQRIFLGTLPDTKDILRGIPGNFPECNTFSFISFSLVNKMMIHTRKHLLKLRWISVKVLE